MQKKLLLGSGSLIVLGILGYLFVLQNKQTEGDVLQADELLGKADHIVEVTDAGFEPERLTVQKGDTVVWVNRGSGYYWPASDIHPTHERYSEFDPLEPLAPGEAWAFTFERAGAWECHDHLRPSRSCAVVVTE